MKYVTVTLNPAIDQTYRLGKPFRTGELNRASAMSEISFSGKGINVSKELLRLGIDSKVICLIGKCDGDEMYDYLRTEHLNLFCVRTDGRVRRNVSVVDPDGRSVEINEPGDEIGLEDIVKFLSLYEKVISDKESRIVIISGSAPPGFRKDIYKRLIIGAKNAGKAVVLDADGDLLKCGMEGRPDLIKPNADELAAVTGCRLEGSGEERRISALAAAEMIYERTGTEVLCTLAEAGAVFAGKEGRFACPAKEIKIKRFKGAGDIFLAHFIYERQEHGCDVAEAMRRATEKCAGYLEN